MKKIFVFLLVFLFMAQIAFACNYGTCSTHSDCTSGYCYVGLGCCAKEGDIDSGPEFSTVGIIAAIAIVGGLTAWRIKKRK